MKSQKKLALPLCKGKEECEGVTKRGGNKKQWFAWDQKAVQFIAAAFQFSMIWISIPGF